MKPAMAGRKPYPSTIISSSLLSDTKMLPFTPAPAFHEPMVSFESAARDDLNGDDEEDYGGPCGFLQSGAKKRRLSPHQVQFLERSFDEENKLEPERKAQIAKELGLQPRQVAVWFQNRRARSKTKQLEQEYSELRDSYDKLKAECDCLLKEKEQLKEEVISLKEKLLIRDKLLISEDQKSNINVVLELPDEKAAVRCRQEEATSASRSSAIIDSDSPYFTDSSHQPLLLEPANSSHAFEPDCSDFSQEEGDNILEFPRLGHGAYRSPPPATSSCGFGFTAELDQNLWTWPY